MGTIACPKAADFEQSPLNILLLSCTPKSGSAFLMAVEASICAKIGPPSDRSAVDKTSMLSSAHYPRQALRPTLVLHSDKVSHTWIGNSCEILLRTRKIATSVTLCFTLSL